MRTVRPEGLTFRITQPYGLRLWYLGTHLSIHKGHVQIFTRIRYIKYLQQETRYSRYVLSNILVF